MREKVRKKIITTGVILYALYLAGFVAFALCIHEYLPTIPWLAISAVSMIIGLLFMSVINVKLIKRPNATPKEWHLLRSSATLLIILIPLIYAPIDRTTPTVGKWTIIISMSLALAAEFLMIWNCTKKSDAYSTSGYNKEEKRHR